MGFRHLPLAVKDVKKLSEIKEIIDKEYLWAADDNALAIQTTFTRVILTAWMISMLNTIPRKKWKLWKEICQDS
ncbi:hypothetical protein [Massiliimalia timonensis]|uniref:hypothetical protein n=1 Tax=Massiliimalia timonensis TaxID=1987501 RepID=UPI00189D9B32|nr:hypothetical protein [Massiliimalia timonensis]